MRGGATSAELFGRYGGLDSLSKGAVNLINYVYGYRANADVTNERIAALTTAKCRAGAFGDVSCEALPISYTAQLGGCNPDADGDPAEQHAAQVGESQLKVSPQESALQPSGDTQRAFEETVRANAEKRRERCREMNQRSIDNINAQMRGGYTSAQGERFREQLRELRKKLRDC